MHTQQEFDRHTRKKYLFLTGYTLVASTLLVVCLFVLAGASETLNLFFGSGVEHGVMLLSLLIVCVEFMLTLALITQGGRNFDLACDCCGEILTERNCRFVQATKRCHRCDIQVIRSENVRTRETYVRWQRMKSKIFAYRAVWLFALVSVACLPILSVFDGPQLADLAGANLPALIGLVCGVYGAARSRKLRFLAPAAVSLVSLVLGGLMIYRAIA